MYQLIFWAVLVCGIISMVVGVLWYSVLFGKMWMKVVGKTEESMKSSSQLKMMSLYLTSIICALIMAYILAHFVVYTNSDSLILGVQTGFWSWLGFIATTGL